MVLPPKNVTKVEDTEFTEEDAEKLKAKLAEEEEKAKDAPEPLQETGIGLRHLIRGINAKNEFHPEGSRPLAVIEDELNSMLLQGYKLIYVQHLRSNYTVEKDAVLSEQMLYVFQRE